MKVHMACARLTQYFEIRKGLQRCFSLNIQQAIGSENRRKPRPEAIQPSLVERRIQHDQVERWAIQALQDVKSVTRVDTHVFRLQAGSSGAQGGTGRRIDRKSVV